MGQVTPVRLPDGVREMGRRGADWARWVERLPRLAADLLREWRLVQDGIAEHGNTALVLPVRTAEDFAAVLKIGHLHEESRHEHLALRHWHGDGAVRLLRADPNRGALLLERLRPSTLAQVDDLEACQVVAALYRRLHRPAPPQLRRLSDRVAGWVDLLHASPGRAGAPRRLVEQALSIAADLLTDDATDGVLVHGDLHYLNVMAGEREPWLVIDPKPLSGDPHVECAPMLWNRWEEAVASGDVRTAVRRRFSTLVETAGFDEDRARDWVVLWETVNAVEELSEPEPEPAWITASITVAKAVQD